MSTVTLHYLYDPFCGWCYGAAPLVSAAAEIESVNITLHGIGMLYGDQNKCPVSGAIFSGHTKRAYRTQ